MLEEYGKLEKYSSGQVVFQEGDNGNEMYIVRDGKVEIYRDRDGEQVTLATIGRDEFFGEMAFFGDSTRSASARAVGMSEIQIIDKDTFLTFIKEPVVWAVMNKMSQRIKEADDKLTGYWSK